MELQYIEFKYDFVASRATTILNDVIQYLTEREYISKEDKSLRR